MEVGLQVPRSQRPRIPADDQLRRADRGAAILHRQLVLAGGHDAGHEQQYVCRRHRPASRPRDRKLIDDAVGGRHARMAEIDAIGSKRGIEVLEQIQLACFGRGSLGMVKRPHG